MIKNVALRKDLTSHRFWRRGLACAITAVLAVASAWAATSPAVNSASLDRFILSGGYGADGYKGWDLEGRQTLMQSSDKVDIANLKLRLFSSVDPHPVEATIDSPVATVNPANSTAHGDDFLTIKGGTYLVTGRNWTWDGKSGTTSVGRDVAVTFTAPPTPATPSSPAKSGTPVLVHSDSLIINEDPKNPGRNLFSFTGNVDITSTADDKAGNTTSHTTSRSLEVIAARSATGATPTPATGGNAAGAGQIERIFARDNVHINQGEIEAQSQLAEIVPSTQQVILSGLPQVHELGSDATLQGGRIIWWNNNTQRLEVEPRADGPNRPARVRVSLPPLSASTADEAGVTKPTLPPVVNAPRLVITGESQQADMGQSGRHFVVNRSVHVEDPELKMDTNRLEAEFSPLTTDPKAPVANSPAAGAPSVGKLTHLLASGAVVVHQLDPVTKNDRVTTADQAEIFPKDNTVVLTGHPHIDDSKADISGERIILITNNKAATPQQAATKDERAFVAGSATTPATLILPPPRPAAGAPPPPANAGTRITSQTISMSRGNETTLFKFTGGVQVNAQDMNSTSDLLEANALNAATPSTPGRAAGPGQIGGIVSMVATGHVLISQEAFQARGAMAQIVPEAELYADTGEGSTPTIRKIHSVTLRGDPSGATGPLRPIVTLPPLGDLGWDLPMGNVAKPVAPVAPPAVPSNTTIISDEQQLLTTPSGNNTYLFKGHVQIVSSSMNGTCDEMTANARPDPSPAPGSVSGSSSIDYIVATGNVRFAQGTRIATGGKAEIFVGNGTVILSDHPLLLDSADGSRAGDVGQRLVFDRGAQRARVEVDPTMSPPSASSTPGQPAKPAPRNTIFLPRNAINFDNLGKALDKPSTPPRSP
jgi:lipopolysaccharide export system protein LptA